MGEMMNSGNNTASTVQTGAESIKARKNQELQWYHDWAIRKFLAEMQGKALQRDTLDKENQANRRADIMRAMGKAA